LYFSQPTLSQGRIDMSKITTEWQVWTYEVWGNAKDGYEVNDRRCQDRHYELELEVQVNNPGTEREFKSAFPVDAQLKKVFGVKGKIETDGDDMTIYVSRARDGYPIGELLCVSHESLSPIRETQPEPEEGDYTTTDHVNFYQYGKLVVIAVDDWKRSIKAHMDNNRFHPNVFFISDHGNTVLLSLED
jgi:hypothetical protein